MSNPQTKGLKDLKPLLLSHKGRFHVYKQIKGQIFKVTLSKDKEPTIDLDSPLKGPHTMIQPCVLI